MLYPLEVYNQVLKHPLLDEKKIELQVKRLDLIHPNIQGNKFFKLKYNLSEAKAQGFKSLLTFGGAYSNHILATAEAAYLAGFSSFALIRGEKTEPLNPTLDRAKKLGMHLEYIDRSSYRLKAQPEFIQKLNDKFGDFYLIPEGGTNELAIRGTQEILTKEDEKFTHIACSIGTGGTFTGLAISKRPNQKLMGFSSLKGKFIHEEIESLINKYSSKTIRGIQIFDSYHFGGYAKQKPELIEFIWEFFENFNILLDPIYTAKAAFGLWDQIIKDNFPEGSKILLIHTGGLQGNSGFTERTGIKLPAYPLG